MRSVRESLRLRAQGFSLRDIARLLRVSKTAVGKYLDLAHAAALSWPLPDELDDDALERRLYTDAGAPAPPRRHAEPDCAHIHRELKRKGVTLQLLWEEYRDAHPDDGYQLTQFGDCYRTYRAGLRLSMRQTHRAGDKLFVDYAGQTVPILDGGVSHEAAIFVAVLGASNYTYVEATLSQRSVDWISSHERAFRFFGGVPALLVPDNLKSGVTTAHRYEPVINRTYEELARHYDTAVLPARPRKPKDKAKVENAVLVVSRWILARLRAESFASLAGLNARIGGLLVQLNSRPFRRLPGCRRSLFEELEQAALRPLPGTLFVTGTWSTARVGPDYHVVVDGHAYSVPHALVRKVVDIRAGAVTVEILHGHRRVASHLRSPAASGHTTCPEHQPASHRAHAAWTPRALVAWAREVGASVGDAVERMLETKPHPEQGYRACLGLRALAKKHGEQRLEAACLRALAIDDVSLRGIESILRRGLDRLPLPGEVEDLDIALVHENVRGAAYYRERSGAATEAEGC